MTPMAPVETAPVRPGGVTFACVSCIVLSALGVLFGLFIMLLGSIIGAIVGTATGFGGATGLGASIGLILGVIPLAMGVLGIVAGAQGLKGASWARWTMVALFGLGALLTVGGIAADFPLAVTAIDVVAIVMLVNGQANAWFARVDGEHRTMMPS